MTMNSPNSDISTALLRRSLAAINERDRLGREIADESAAETVTVFSVQEIVDGEPWLNVDHASILLHEREMLERAARYLDLRCLIARHPTRPNHVRVLEPKS